jgi:hypothetical protein
VDGSYNGKVLPPDKQYIITDQENIDAWYIYSLIDVLSQFGGPPHTRGNIFAWCAPTTSTSVAAMVWSRIIDLGSHLQFNASEFNSLTGQINGTGYAWLTYPVTKQTNLYNRSTMQETGLLYLIIAIQPLLLIFILMLTATFHSTPVDKGLRLLSILSMVDR